MISMVCKDAEQRLTFSKSCEGRPPPVGSRPFMSSDNNLGLTIGMSNLRRIPLQLLVFAIKSSSPNDAMGNVDQL